ncbi:MAG: hypothetical protein LUE93_13105, partial [Bacteroides sp.]|nr:hypothetical protein [Bacteroides sp.]
MKEKTTIEIREAESGHYVINMKLENGTIWLTAHQIAQLFDVFISKVTTNIISIYKNDILSDETYKLHKYTNKKTIECHVELYNLD